MSVPNRYFLDIAETIVEVSSTDAGMPLRVRGAQGRFQVADARPDIRIEAAFGYTAIPQNPPIFDTGGLWKVYYKNGSYLFTFSSPIFGPLPYKTAQFNADFSNGKVFLHRPYFPVTYEVDPLQWPLDEILISHLLGLGTGVELHAAGLIDTHGRGHLFVGHSGAGKSTMTKLWEDLPGVVILSDDRIILRRKKGRFFMYGTPWHGDARHASPAAVHVAAIYLLEHGDATRVIPLARSQATARLFTMSLAAFYSQDAVTFTLDFLDRLVNTVPCFELPFIPHKSAVDTMLGEAPHSLRTGSLSPVPLCDLSQGSRGR